MQTVNNVVLSQTVFTMIYKNEKENEREDIVMRKNKIRRLMAAALTAAMVVSMGGMSALAATAGNVPATGSADALKVTKYLVMATSANVPNATFEFEINAGSGKDATTTTPKVLPGNDPEKVSISKAVFSPTDEPSRTTTDKDALTLNDGEMYAKKEVNVDFSNVTFEEPGIYRYEITEKEPTADGVTKIDNKLYLDVYVTTNETGQLTIDKYILHKTDEVANVSGSYTSKDEKTTGFVNKYTTNDLSLTKKVTGNQGNVYEYFEFELKIQNASEGTVYTIDNSNASYPSNPEKITVEEGGSVRTTIYLHDKESVVIQGLTANTKYEIKEIINSTEGYTTTNNKATDKEDGLTTGIEIMGNTRNDVVFTNHKQVTSPTGIALFFAPYALLVVLAGVFGVLFLRKRRDDEI